jgi:uncharacterized protein (DUF2132 family)
MTNPKPMTPPQSTPAPKPKTFPHPGNPQHGITLEMILNELVESYGWEKLGKWIHIQCFRNHPSVASSLTFLRRTPWARAKVEELYKRHKKNPGRHAARNYPPVA